MKFFMSTICVLLLANVVGVFLLVHVNRWGTVDSEGSMMCLVDRITNKHYYLKHANSRGAHRVITMYSDEMEFEEMPAFGTNDPRNIP